MKIWILNGIGTRFYGISQPNKESLSETMTWLRSYIPADYPCLEMESLRREKGPPKNK